MQPTEIYVHCGRERGEGTAARGGGKGTRGSGRDEVAARRSRDHTESRACSWLVGGPSFHFPLLLHLLSFLPLFSLLSPFFSFDLGQKFPPVTTVGYAESVSRIQRKSVFFPSPVFFGKLRYSCSEDVQTRWKISKVTNKRSMRCWPE